MSTNNRNRQGRPQARPQGPASRAAQSKKPQREPRPEPMEWSDEEQELSKVFTFNGKDYYSIKNPPTETYLEFRRLVETGTESDYTEFICSSMLVDDAYEVLLGAPLPVFRNTMRIMQDDLLGAVEENKGN